MGTRKGTRVAATTVTPRATTTTARATQTTRARLDRYLFLLLRAHKHNIIVRIYDINKFFCFSEEELSVVQALSRLADHEQPPRAGELPPQPTKEKLSTERTQRLRKREQVCTFMTRMKSITNIATKRFNRSGRRFWLN